MGREFSLEKSNWPCLMQDQAVLFDNMPKSSDFVKAAGALPRSSQTGTLCFDAWTEIAVRSVSL